MKKLFTVLFMYLMVMSANAQYVDLGLPSGTLWKQENESGGFFSYGEAIRNFGDKLPTKAQCEELKKYCTWNWGWTSKYGEGYTVTGSNGNQIFIPALGNRPAEANVVYNEGRGGWIWSSTYEEFYDAGEDRKVPMPCALMCASHCVDVINCRVGSGLSVRLVK